MKKLIFTILYCLPILAAQAQEFTKQLAVARSTYSAKKLDETRFALQQMLQELDMIAAKDILKLLPAKLDALNSNPANDNISGASGFAGVIIHREYGTGDKIAAIDIIGNSPLMASINAILSLPFVGSSGNQKVIKLEGYKALLQKTSDSDTSPTYEIQLPLNSSLLTLKVPNSTEEEIKKLAATIPVSQLAKNLQ